MSTLWIAVGAFVLYLVAYHTYGRWLARRIFRLDPKAPVPSVELADDTDYVPTAKSVVFGHHFTSIAGTGPIVGPAIAVMWGWVPALLWVIFGSILIGAVHDFGALVISLRSRGQTVGDIAGRVITPRARILFLSILFLALSIVLAIFGLVIAAVFRQFPAAIFPCLVQIPIAVAIGVWIHRRGKSLLIPSLIALGLMYASVVFGHDGFLGDFNGELASWWTIVWVALLLIYSYVASVLPVWSLLQPRDYINSLQLLSALGLVVAGLFTAALIGGAPVGGETARPLLDIAAAPAFEMHPAGAPMIFPFLFITIACGAISGFHCLVSSGTSSKQLRCETDAQLVGYGSMLTEGFLAVLVILACTAGLSLGVRAPDGSGFLTGAAAWSASYVSWDAAKGLATTVGAFVRGSANFLEAMGIPDDTSIPLMGVLVASFAGTTLDTACRLQRYVIQELAGALGSIGQAEGSRARTTPVLEFFQNRHGATLLAVVLAGALATLPRPGQEWTLATAGSGGQILWPMFGATNQLLGGLSFLVVAFWLRRRRLPSWFAVPPAIFLLVVPAWAMIDQGRQWLAESEPNWVLITVASATLVLELWLIVEAVLVWKRAEGELEAPLPPLPLRAVRVEVGTESGRSA